MVLRLYLPILKQRWDFYRFSRSLLRAVLLPFYVKSAELLHYPHPMKETHRRKPPNANGNVSGSAAVTCLWSRVEGGDAEGAEPLHSDTLRTFSSSARFTTHD